MKLSAAVVSVVGNVRKVNQDNFYMDHVVRPLTEQDYAHHCSSDDDVQVYSVCDGMGGEEAGEEASLRAVQKLSEMSVEYLSEHWREFIDQANESVCQLCRERSIRAGTTFTGAFFHEKQCIAVNVGDSRIYLISKGSIRQISVDHTQFQTMVDAGLIEPDDKTHTKARSQLTQHFGIEKHLLELEPHVEYLNSLQSGDIILMCSDGMYGDVSDDEMLSIIENEDDLQKCCESLIRTAEMAGSRDNITAMLIRVEAEQVNNNKKTVSCVSVRPDEFNRDIVSESPKGLSMLSVITMVLGIVCVVLAVILMMSAHAWPVVSDVTGQTMAKAKQTLENSGFQVVLDGDSSDAAESLLVTAQSIPGSVRAKRGSEITLILGNSSDEGKMNSEEEPDVSKVSGLIGSSASQIQDNSTVSADNIDSSTEGSISKVDSAVVWSGKTSQNLNAR